jgi:tight adherence protein B
MVDLWQLGALSLGLGGIAWYWHNRRQRAISIDRLSDPFIEDPEFEPSQVPVGLTPRYRWAAHALVLGLGASLWLLASWEGVFCIAAVLIGWVIVSISFSALARRRGARLEVQLTEAIDLIVGSLHAGAGTLDALDNAAREVREPLGSHLRDLVGAIRLGETPQAALQDLHRAIPLESFRLFAFTLSVHEETGGSLAPTLSMVARSIRDNVDLRRRVNAETTQAQFSVFGILFITYGIGFVTWRAHPDRFESFISDDYGIRVIAAAVVMQAVGLFWMTRLTKIRF